MSELQNFGQCAGNEKDVDIEASLLKGFKTSSILRYLLMLL